MSGWLRFTAGAVKRGKLSVIHARTLVIPAQAGISAEFGIQAGLSVITTIHSATKARRDSRLRGNDGKKGVGMTERGGNDGRIIFFRKIAEKGAVCIKITLSAREAAAATIPDL